MAGREPPQSNAANPNLPQLVIGRRCCYVTERSTKEELTLISLAKQRVQMTITLTPELEKLVKEKVARGEYDSADAFVGEAVQQLVDQEKEEDAHQDQILARIQIAEAEIDRGDCREYDEETIHELAKDVHDRGLKKLAAERGQTGISG
jgi:antitoxin ParD1/3/4